MSTGCQHRYVKFVNSNTNTVIEAFRAKCTACAKKYHHAIKSSLGDTIDDIIISQLHSYLKSSNEPLYKKHSFVYRVAKELNLVKWIDIPSELKYKKNKRAGKKIVK